MRVSLNGLVRLVGLLALVSCAVAVGLARLEPAAAHFRLAAPPHYGVINGFVLSTPPGETRFLDAETGRFCRITVPEGDRLDYGTCSPWQDEEGESQVVGRWSRRTPGGAESLAEEFGLARYSVPSGRVLDRVPLEVVPAGHPCWFPGTAARVLYAGTDGRLYRLSFEGPGAAGGAGGDPPRPQPIDWRCPAPGIKQMVRDPVWPTDPRLGGRLIVTLSYRPSAAELALTPGRLWWLRLSDDGAAVVDAGPLTETEPAAGQRPLGRAEERFPNLAVTPDGALTLAYLWQRERTGVWDLRLARVAIDSETGDPMVPPEGVRTVAGGHLSELPPFSADGRYVYAVLDRDAATRAAKVVPFPTAPSPTAASALMDSVPCG
jgi:hypothetical protein